MSKIIGIDEAGRGPVIGPMVMCGVLISQDKNKRLKEMGVKDSKLLTEKRRDELEPEVKKIVDDYKVVIIPAEEIDNLIKSGTNLNKIEMLKTAEIINSLEGDIAIIDCPSPNLGAYKELLKTMLSREVELIVEHKADLNHLEVGAASIIAKVLRDNEIKRLQKQYDTNFGSGYTSDPLTQKFIKENWERFPELFRHSWSSWKNLEFNKNQKSLGDF